MQNKRLKIAYISGKAFSDVDLSFLPKLMNNADVDYFVPVSFGKLTGAAFNLNQLYPKNGIFFATDAYPELKRFQSLIDCSHFFVINSCCQHYWHYQNILLYIQLTLRLRQYDVIHLTDFPYYYEYPIYAHRKKILLTVHDPIPHSSAACNRKMIHFNRWLGFRLLSHFVILNQSQKEEFIQSYHLQHKNIYCSRLSRYTYLNLYHTAQQDLSKYILFFGQIASNKGLEFLLPAMVKLHNDMPNYKLVVAGRGDYYFDVKRYQDLDYIHLINRFIPDEELAHIIQHSQFVVCPYSDATQSGVVMSAFAFDKPVIATNVGGFPEQLNFGKYGLIIPPRDVEQLYHAMHTLCTNPNLLYNFSHAIHLDFEHGEKSWDFIASEMTTIYKTICS